MAAQCPRYDDTGPFASYTHELIYGGSELQKHDFQMRDRDVTLVVEGANRNLRLLHLQNVRPDTVAVAKAAVDGFLEQVEPTDYPERVEHTVFQDFDKVRRQLREHVRAARVEVQDLCDELEWVEDFPKRVADTRPEDLNQAQPGTRDDNPVAVVRAACEVFLEQLNLVDDSDEPPKRQAHTMHENADEAHLEIWEYMEAQAEKRGLVLEWCDGTFPRNSLRNASSKIIYNVYFSEDGSWDSHYGMGG